MTITKYTGFGFIAALALVALFAVLYMGRPATPQTFGQVSPTMFSPMTNTGTLCTSGASTQIVATSTSRQFISISNQSAYTIFLGLGVPAATSSGITLFASTTIQLNETNLYGGAIYCLAVGGNASTTVAEEK